MPTDRDAQDELSDFTELMRQERELSAGLADIDPKARSRRRRIGWIIAAVVVLILFGTPAAYAAWALNAPVSAPTFTSQAPAVPTPATAAIALPSEGASAISISGADEYLGGAASGIWAATGTDEARPIASISKVITALVVLGAMPLADATDPGPTLTFDKADHDLYDKYYVLGATIAAMPTGSSMSQRDALGMMLIPSASNYAEAVATWAFGSQGAFLDATREWLDAHGLVNTTIVEPTGISSRNTSTPSELIAIAKLADADPVISQIVATPSISPPDLGRMANTNDLLGVDGIDGLKTGNLGEGAFALVYTASLGVGVGEPLRVTGVVLGGFSRATADRSVTALLESIRAGFHDVPVATAGQVVGSFSTPWGSTARMVVNADASILTWSDTPITVAMQTSTPATYQDGEVIGKITWTAGPNTATADVVIEGSVEPPTEWWRLTHPSELGG
jgi:D-alanyl-D-alanine carboxypeptidase (penicillin-binding protein 5/6)